MRLSTQEVRNVYQRQAKHYDLALRLYRLIGLRHDVYRLRAVDRLRLRRGDRVVDLGCGTGASFPLLIDKIGSEGRLIGVDIAPAMLAVARERVEASRWNNVELVQSDMASYEFPQGINGVLSVGAFGYVADCERVIEKASRALIPGGRIVILDGKRPERWPSWLVRFFVRLSRPFGLPLEYFDGRPWVTVERLFEDTALEEMYGGMVFISSGAAPQQAA